MKCHYACGSSEHLVSRRDFVAGAGAGGLAVAGASGLGAFTSPAIGEQLDREQKRVLCVFLAGGVSQLETWDPKPMTDTGGPFRAIPTSVKGVHVSELLPYTAKQMHHLSVVRSLNTRENNHGQGKYLMLRGRRQSEPGDYPALGAVSAKALDTGGGLPGHIQIAPKGKGSRTNDAAYLEPKYAGLLLDGGSMPANAAPPKGLTADTDQRRHALRRMFDDRYLSHRRTAFTDLYTQSFEQANELMRQRDAFDVSKESEKDQERYGKHDFGRHCLLARRLLTKGVTYVQVTHTNYDSHHENFNFHIEQLGEFDRSFATLIDDLAVSGLLKHTLVVVMSEFGRTPKINDRYGRDHWGTAWSVALGGCGIVPGSVYGATNKNGTAVSDNQVDHGHLFHTYLQALGVDSSGSFDIAGRKMPMASPAAYPIEELLA